MTIKGNTWDLHDFFNAAAIACFWYFISSDIFSVIARLAFDNDNVSLIQISSLHTWVLFVIFFSASKSKLDF